MNYQFTMDSPLYLQLVDVIKQQIAQGMLPPGAQFEECAELAAHYGTNENTVKRALTVLEHEGLAVSDKTGAYFITLATPRIDNLRSSLLEDEAQSFVRAARTLGISLEDALKVISTEWKDQVVSDSND